MPTNNYTATNASGVTYALVYTPASILPPVVLTPFYTLTITYPGGGGTQTISNIPPDNVLTSSGGTLTIASALAGADYVVPAGVTGSVNITIALATLTPNVIYVGGTATISSTVSALSSLVIQVDGGNATAASGALAGALSGMEVNLDNGGTFGNGSAVLSVLNGTTINFGTGGGTFIANAGNTFLNLSSTTINGFNAATDAIEFQNLTGTLDHYTVTTNGDGTQTIDAFDSNNTELATVTVGGTSFQTGSFNATGAGPLTVSEDGTTLTIRAEVTPCFVTGTLIQTTAGEVAVETLRIGDIVLTANGHMQPVRWIGRTTVATRFADPLRSMPVRIRAGALGEGLPKRDLLVSPDHAIFTDGVLVQAGALVNGVSVVRESWMPPIFAYFHVELEQHSLLLAEGLPAESFVDNVDRMSFDNWAEHEALFDGNATSVQEMPYPRAQSVRQVPRFIQDKMSDQFHRFTAETPIAA